MLIRMLPAVAVALLLTGYTAVQAAHHEGEAEKNPVNDWPLVFSDNFEEGRINWKYTDAGAWRIADEDGNRVMELHQSSAYEPKVRSPRSIAWAKDVNVSSFVLDAKLKQTGREYGHRDLCLFFGKQDDSHFYYVHIATKADAHANSIFLVNDEPRVSIATERTDGTKWINANWHHVRLVRDANAGTIAVYFDDMEKPIMQAEDKTFGSGPIGLGSFDDVGHFDDIKVWGVAVEEDAK